MTLALIVLALAAASFIYIAVSDLAPHLQRQSGLRAGALQLLLITTGGVTVLLGHVMTHAHAH
jgi:zinc and cadmium transporter